MSKTTRRDFVKRGTAGAIVLATAGLTQTARAARTTKEINLGVIGCGGRWRSVAEFWARQDGVRIRYLCDINRQKLAEAANQINLDRAGVISDMRRIFDDAAVDAVYIATPDHWHTPAAIHACDSGKHVYVEKPIGHNVREGRLLIDAAHRNKRVVQHGTQVRSTPTIVQAIKALQDGIIGDVLVAKAWNIQMRKNIGHEQPSAPPEYLDYDQWVGPVPMIPFQANCYGQWHYWFHFGTGDMGNDGVHDIDYARWGLGVTQHPRKVSATGGKYFFDDDQEFPDTQQVAFEFPGSGTSRSRMLIYEQRLWSSNYPSVYNCDSGVEYYGTGGRMFLSRRGKIQVLGPSNKPIQLDVPKMPQDTELHIANFLECIRTDQTPNADAETGHLTSTLCHLGNVSTRLGRSLEFDGVKEQVVGDDEANKLLKRDYREHWAKPSNA
jgi:predicted dehydrogenase